MKKREASTLTTCYFLRSDDRTDAKTNQRTTNRKLKHQFQQTALYPPLVAWSNAW